jgi:hypothetical protein
MYSLIDLYFIYCFCFIVTYCLTILASATLPSTYGSTTTFLMPVTTRSHAKLFPGIALDISKLSSSDSTLPSGTLNNNNNNTIPIVIASNFINPITSNSYYDADRFFTTSSSSPPDNISLTTISSN